jgi:hypothetical protein
VREGAIALWEEEDDEEDEEEEYPSNILPARRL